MVKIVPWENGTGSITLTYAGQGDGPILIQSDPNNLNVSRSKILQVTAGSLHVEITINQQANQGPQPTDYVDLGLPSGKLWAKGNIVKNAQGVYSMGEPTDYGCYFSWGNIDGYNIGDSYTFNQSSYDITPGAQLTADIASNDALHDAAFAHLGGSWHIPTRTEAQELLDYTDYERATINGINGIKFMKKTDHSVFIFIPSAGFDLVAGSINLYGDYWTSSYQSSLYVYKFDWNPNDIYAPRWSNKYNGYSIRAVRNP